MEFKLKVDVKSFSKYHINATVYALKMRVVRDVQECMVIRKQVKNITHGLFWKDWLVCPHFLSIALAISWTSNAFSEDNRDRRVVSMIHDFREAIKECYLVDLGNKGHLVTRSNKKPTPSIIGERLDYFLCNKAWGKMFLSAAETLET